MRKYCKVLNHTSKHKCGRDLSAIVKSAFVSLVMMLIPLFSSCDSQDGSLKQEGTLSLFLKADTASLGKGVSNGLTKVWLEDELEPFTVTDDYVIRIFQGEDTVKKFSRFDEMPAEIKLTEGSYLLSAHKGEDLPAAFDNPYFEGSTAFVIKEDMTTPLEVTVTMANARFSVQYTKDFLEVYEDYTVLLSSPFATDEFEIKKDEIRSVYMQIAKEGTEVAVGIRLKKKGEDAEKTYYIPTPLSIERRQNVHLIFKTDGAALEGIGLDVVLDDTMEEMTFTTEIPDFMWDQFIKPTLTYPTQFNETNGYEITVQTSRYEEDPLVGFAMPAGVGHLYIKYWLGENEDDYHLFDLATDEGVEDAKGRRFSWGVGTDETNQNLKNERKTGSIHFKNAIRSLEAPTQEGAIYTYYFELYGSDATGKENPTQTLKFKVNVKAAGDPFIDSWSLPQEIVEGDLYQEIKTKLIAEGQIDTENTILSIVAGSTSAKEEYKLMNSADRERLKEKYGINVTSEDDIEAQMLIPADFISRLTVPNDNESETYTVTLSLQDLKGRKAEKRQSILVKKPVFSLLSDNGDAFAKRVVLRVDMSVGNPDHVSFRYKKESEAGWSEYKGTLSLVEGNAFEDVLKELTPETVYMIQIVYNSGKSWERVGNEVKVTTESIGVIPNGGFENSWYSRTISKMINGANIFVSRVSLTSDDPESWATVNTKTFAEESNVNSTYNRVPSTMKYESGYDGVAVRLRTVGWDNGAGNTVTICYHAAAGKLFLGSYSYNHSSNTDAYNYGISFNSRPSYVKAYYKYSPVKGDSFKAWIVVLNREGGKETVIGSGELVSGETVTSWREMKFEVKYTDLTKKATHMYVAFSSSVQCSDDEGEETSSLKPLLNLGGEVDGYTHHEGSNLYIDNVELIYE